MLLWLLIAKPKSIKMANDLELQQKKEAQNFTPCRLNTLLRMFVCIGDFKVKTSQLFKFSEIYQLNNRTTLPYQQIYSRVFFWYLR